MAAVQNTRALPLLHMPGWINLGALDLAVLSLIHNFMDFDENELILNTSTLHA